MSLSRSSIYATLFRGKGYMLFDANFSNDTDLEDFILTLGVPKEEDRNINKRSIYYIQKEDIPNATSFARTKKEFSLHTDCSNESLPPDIVFLYCVEECPHGGMTELVDRQDLNIPKYLMNQLRKEYFFGYNQYRILSPILIRYNRLLLNFYNKKDIGNVFDDFEQILNEYKWSLKLKAGQSILLNNHRFLHGRTAFSSNDRLLKRARLWSQR